MSRGLERALRHAREHHCHEGSVEVFLKIERPLFDAVHKGDTEAVCNLLAGRADPNAVDDERRAPLVYAARFSDHQVVALLVYARADPCKESTRASFHDPVMTEMLVNPLESMGLDSWYLPQGSLMHEDWHEARKLLHDAKRKISYSEMYLVDRSKILGPPPPPDLSPGWWEC